MNDLRVIWPIRWRVGFYTGVRHVRAADGDEATDLVSYWCSHHLLELIRTHGFCVVTVENKA